MSTGIDRHTRRRLATRQRISDIATALFAEHGFDRITIDAIADAADVGRMTVFNHFARKEDLFFDREAEIRLILRGALQAPSSTHPVERLRRLAHDLVTQGAPFLRFAPQTQGFIDTLMASETLKSRARALRDEVTEELSRDLARAFQDCATGTPPSDRPPPAEKVTRKIQPTLPDSDCGPDGRIPNSPAAADPLHHLCASVLVASWVTAFVEAQRLYVRTGDSLGAQALFLSLVDTGSAAARVMTG